MLDHAIGTPWTVQEFLRLEFFEASKFLHSIRSMDGSTAIDGEAGCMQANRRLIRTNAVHSSSQELLDPAEVGRTHIALNKRTGDSKELKRVEITLEQRSGFSTRGV